MTSRWRRKIIFAILIRLSFNFPGRWTPEECTTNHGAPDLPEENSSSINSLPFPIMFSPTLQFLIFPSVISFPLQFSLVESPPTPGKMRTNSCSSFAAVMWLMFLAFSDVLINAKFIDISHEYVPGLPKYDSSTGLGAFMRNSTVMGIDGNKFNTRKFNLSTDCGTHVKAFTDVESLDLTILNGPVLVVEVPKHKVITAEVMRSLNIPKGVKRVLFRTLNTKRRLMYKAEFDSSYTGFQKDGAEWLVRNTDIKLIGLDYLSVAVKPDKADVYQVLGKDVISVEGLNLDKVKSGEYFLHCLPLLISEANAAPTRCILVR